MTAVGYQASANVKLVLPADFNAVNNAYLTGGCTVEVPEGVTLTLAPGSSSTLSNIGGLVGAGTLVAPTDSGALNNFIASEKYSGWLKAATWTGTLQCSGDSKSTSFANIANPNAAIRFSGFTNYTHNATSASGFAAIELVGDGLSLAGDYSTQNLVWTFANALKGDGTLDVAVTGNGSGNYLKTIKFTGDVSGFAGNIKFTNGASFDARDVLIFGNDSSSVTQAVVVSSGVVMTNATGKTWNAPGGVVVNGELVANGTVSGTALFGSGTYRANSNSAKIATDSSWTGIYYVGGLSGKVSITDYGKNADATIAVTGMTDGWLANPGSGNVVADITAKLRLDGNMTINNGLSTTTTDWSENVTKFAYLTGTGNLSFAFSANNGRKTYYEIKSLDPSYSGTISTVANVALKIDEVDFARTPAVGTELSSTLALAADTVFDPSAIAVKVAGTVQDDLSLELVNGKLTVASNAPADPWNTPSSDADVADSLSKDGITTDSGAVTTVAEFNALVDYITNHVAGVSAPGDMSSNQKANAVLCYALNATTIPNEEITSADVTIDAATTGASGSMTLTVAIAGVTVGNVDASLVAKVVSAKGGTALNEMSAANVDVSAYGSDNGKVVITVTPTKANSGDPDPTTFFMSAVITK